MTTKNMKKGRKNTANTKRGTKKIEADWKLWFSKTY